MNDDPDMNAAHGGPVAPPEQRNWGPGGPRAKSELILRAAYEAKHGSDPDNWPHRHPGIVIDAVQFVAHAACLGCQGLAQPGNSMSDAGWREAAAAVARRHESSHGEFRGQPDQ
jgi:hypothetical protein